MPRGTSERGQKVVTDDSRLKGLKDGAAGGGNSLAAKRESRERKAAKRLNALMAACARGRGGLDGSRCREIRQSLGNKVGIKTSPRAYDLSYVNRGCAR